MDDAMNLPPARPERPPGAAEHLAILKPDHPVPIGKSRFAPLSLLLSHRDPHCKFCSTREGWVTVVLVDGARADQVCGCCAERYKKHAAATEREQKKAAAIGIAPLPSEGEQQRLVRRLTRLTDEMVTLERELAERSAGLEQDLQPLVEERNNHVASVQDIASSITRHADQIRTLTTMIADAELKLAELMAALRGEEDDLKQAEFSNKIASAMVVDVDGEIERRKQDFDKRTRRLRRDVERARARLARAQVYNGVGTEPEHA